MTMMARILTGCAGLAALATAAPVTAQYYYSANATQMAAQRCAAAVQNRLSSRGGFLGLFGDDDARVLSVTRAEPRRTHIRVRGLATSDAYGPYGVGAFGTLGAAYAPRADLSFRCDVDYRGFVRDVDIMRR